MPDENDDWLSRLQSKLEGDSASDDIANTSLETLEDCYLTLMSKRNTFNPDSEDFFPLMLCDLKMLAVAGSRQARRKIHDRN